MICNKKSVFVLVTGLSLMGTAWAADYEIDPAHSSANFKIRHLVNNVTGKFNKLKGTFTFEKGKLEAAKVDTTIEVASIDTTEAKRDKHLRSADFFNTEKFPTMTFKSDKVSGGDEKFTIEGTLTIHGISKHVTFETEYTGEGKDPWGNKQTGFTATTKIDRKDFGLNWNKALDKGGVLIGDEVMITMEIAGNEKVAKLAGEAKAVKKAKAKKE